MIFDTPRVSAAEGARRSVGLKLVHLQKRYGAVTAIDSVTLDVAPGEFLTLLGSSGSGKSTTLMSVAGFVRPTGGQILIDGRDQTATPPHQRDIGLVFQHYALFPHLDVARNIAFPLEMRKIGKAETDRRVADALRLVRLEGFAHRKPSQLSGGQSQRVALARALVYEPSILLLDEPLGALDRNLREEMQVEIRRIQKSLGITTIAVTHDQHEAITMSDRIAVMRLGRLDQIGTPAQVYERPRTRFVAQFMGASNFVNGTAARVVDGARLLEVQCGGAAVRIERREGLHEQGPMDVVVRPERLEVSTSQLPRGNGWTATVQRLSYTGGAWRIDLALPTGECIAASLASVGTPDLREGRQVHVGFDPSAAWSVPAGE
jgi:spermidine/putrescine ABC transporter ATP-binding subunit